MKKISTIIVIILFFVINANSQNEILNNNYPASKGESTNDEWIRLVVVGEINNKSESNDGYADFTSHSTTMNIGSTQEIIIHPGWTGTLYHESYCVWIDYNQDGDFDEDNELVYVKEKSKEKFVKAEFTVPADAINGTTRMRVSMSYAEIPLSDKNFAYGEVEDYSIIIEPEDIFSEIYSEATKISVYPNPTADLININTKNNSNIEVEIFSATGTFLLASNSPSINISKLSEGIYTLKINTGEEIYYEKILKKK